MHLLKLSLNKLTTLKTGVWVVNIHTGNTIAFVEFEDALQEIFAVQVMAGMRNPDLINENVPLIMDSFELPHLAICGTAWMG